jgi:hypothetical protein
MLLPYAAPDFDSRKCSRLPLAQAVVFEVSVLPVLLLVLSSGGFAARVAV